MREVSNHNERGQQRSIKGQKTIVDDAALGHPHHQLMFQLTFFEASLLLLYQ